MGQQSIAYLKSKFETGDVPSEQDYIDFLDSYVHNTSSIYEPALGNPSVSGYVLSSTTGGGRSWVPHYSIDSTVILNSAVLTLNSAPISLLSASGSGNLWIPEKMTFRHVFVSAAFATNTTLQLGIGTSAGSAIYVDFASSVLTSVADQIDIETPSIFANVVTNSSVYLKVKTGDPTAGGGSLNVQMIYKKLTSL